MVLNHINLPVVDVAASQAFYAKYFGMTTTLERGENFLAIMRDDAGMVLNLSRFDKATEVHHHKDLHIGFFVESREQVEQIYNQMIADGLDAETPKRAQGRYTFKVQVPGGVETEVACLEGAVW